MDLKIATLCDSACEYENKLCLLGTFDTIETHEFPVVKPNCAYAFQLKWYLGDEGLHNLKVEFVNEEGVNTLKTMNFNLNINIPGGRNFSTTNHIINIQQLKFTKIGNYFAVLYIDNQRSASIQLQIIKTTPSHNSSVVLH
jgi:hypothetical protein